VYEDSDAEEVEHSLGGIEQSCETIGGTETKGIYLKQIRSPPSRRAKINWNKNCRS